jgi:hypothetical protein
MPPPLDVELHVKYIQNLDQVRALYLGWRELPTSLKPVLIIRKKTLRIILQNISV